jgi:hypothetical protein
MRLLHIARQMWFAEHSMRVDIGTLEIRGGKLGTLPKGLGRGEVHLTDLSQAAGSRLKGMMVLYF